MVTAATISLVALLYPQLLFLLLVNITPRLFLLLKMKLWPPNTFVVMSTMLGLPLKLLVFYVVIFSPDQAY
jgi:hypothetical protein